LFVPPAPTSSLCGCSIFFRQIQESFKLFRRSVYADFGPTFMVRVVSFLLPFNQRRPLALVEGHAPMFFLHRIGHDIFPLPCVPPRPHQSPPRRISIPLSRHLSFPPDHPQPLPHLPAAAHSDGPPSPPSFFFSTGPQNVFPLTTISLRLSWDENDHVCFLLPCLLVVVSLYPSP